MQMHPLERELEEFLARLVPSIDAGWEGATPDEITELEALAGRPLPPFYYWFLARMGRYMGALNFASVDFSPARIKACYQEEIEEPSPRYLLIGYENDPVVPMHTWYDLDSPLRGDALVLSRCIGDPLMQLEFETFREMLAWKAMRNFKVEVLPVRCEGSFKSDGDDVRALLDRAIESLGFDQPVPTGSFCGIFDRTDAAMTCSVAPRNTPEQVLFFDLAGNDIGTLRRILGVIAKELEVEVEAWHR
ncbi:SMI1/KNR4 family protein [Nannocystis pusilla]|uniref:SMI1/KNR4 family protein n=1 Tax=Nannocystis pusilla TaxID=889268 RepID=UPI003BF46962